jgi:flagellar biosynthesis protein FlhF
MPANRRVPAVRQDGTMNLKTYRARTMGDALAEVKKDLGKDAVILHTRTYKVGGWLGFGGRPMVEITASDGVNVLPRTKTDAARAVAKPVAPAAAAKAYGMPQVSAGAPRRAVAAAAEGPGETEPRFVPMAVGAAASAVSDAPAARAVARLATEPPAPLGNVAAALDQELAAIKKMVGQVLQCSRHTAAHVSRENPAPGAIPGNAMPDALFQDYLKLLESEVASEIADEVIAKVRDELTPAELTDGAIVRATVLRHLSSLIPAEAELPKAVAARDGRPLTIALVGPTGVGKTTTVAKLAAAYKLRHGKRVGLVTTDTYRIAAVDQLRTYAEIIGLPLKVAMSAAEMGPVIQSLSDCDVVLIDTAGRSQKDSGRLEELRQFIAAARPHQTHLVLASTASESVLVEAAQRFAHVSPDRIIFTKLDEAVNFGVLVTVARRVSLRLSYVTTGQEVPDHIEVGQPERLARLLLEGGRVR